MTTTSGELIADELERFLRDLRSIGRAEPTRKGYAAVIKDLESFCVSQGAPPVVGSLSRTAIQEWLFAMEDRKLSAGTRRHRFAVARRFTRWLLERGTDRRRPDAAAPPARERAQRAGAT